MIPADTLARMRDVAQMIQTDAREDAARYDGTAFTAANVAKQLGEIRAQIDALARLVEHIIDDIKVGDPA